MVQPSRLAASLRPHRTGGSESTLSATPSGRTRTVGWPREALDPAASVPAHRVPTWPSETPSPICRGLVLAQGASAPRIRPSRSPELPSVLACLARTWIPLSRRRHAHESQFTPRGSHLFGGVRAVIVRFLMDWEAHAPHFPRPRRLR